MGKPRLRKVTQLEMGAAGIVTPKSLTCKNLKMGHLVPYFTFKWNIYFLITLYIATMEYYSALKTMKSYQLQQHIWT